MTAHTEKEAAEKWCPHFRGNFAQVGDAAINKGNEEGRCIGSRCMQWRWLDSKTAYYMPSVDVPTEVNREEAMRIIMGDKDVIALMSAGYRASETEIQPPLFSPTGTWSINLSKPRGETRCGYCGLAGRINREET